MYYGYYTEYFPKIEKSLFYAGWKAFFKVVLLFLYIGCYLYKGVIKDVRLFFKEISPCQNLSSNGM